MKILNLAALCLAAGAALISCRQQEEFWLGADITTANGMKARGERLKSYAGEETYELTELMKELGLNAVRYRVWVNPALTRNPDPHAGSCDKEDLLANCLMAKDLGMEIMVDFHYSDTWADPGSQPIPKDWEGHDYEQMKQDLYDHTSEVLRYLKDNGITPKWVQVGNETRNGLLWNRDAAHMGHSRHEPDQYAGFIQAGHEAVKSVFPKAITIVHLDNGYDSAMYDWNLGILERNGVEYDMVGMSLYPYWARVSGRDDAYGVIDDCIANVKHVYERFGKESMIVETGFEVDMDHPELMEEGYRQLKKIIEDSRNLTDGHCHGVFYWAPEARPSPGYPTGAYRLGAFGSDDRPTAIMKAFTEAAGLPIP